MIVAEEATDIGTLIYYKSTFGGGRRACLRESGMSVKCIVNWYKMGLGPDDIIVKYEHLTMAEIFAALAYYYVNKEEIETAIAEDEQAEREGAKVASGKHHV